MKIAKKYILFLAALTVLFTACKEEEVVDNTLRVAFKTFNGSIATAEDALMVELVSSRVADQDLAVTIGVSGACNAALANYTFTDEQGNTLELAGEVALNVTIPAGASSTFFTVATTTNGFPVATEELDFVLVAVENAALNDSHLLFEVLVGTGSGFFSNSYKNDFENCGNQSVPVDFTLFNTGTKDDRSFYCRDTNGETALTVSAFGGETGTVDAWLVAKKKFDFSGASKAVFTMDVISSFEGAGKLELLWSSDYCGSGSPAEVDWINLSALEAKLPAAGSDELMTISANNTAIVGTSGYFAFRLSGATNVSSVGYSIDNFNLTEPTTDNGGGEAVVLLDENFDTACAADGLPANWTSYSVSSDNNWGCSDSNRGFSGGEGDYAVEMNNFNSPDGGAAEDWLVTPVINVVAGTQLSFNSLVRYSGTTVTVLSSTDYVPGNNPNDYTWSNFAAATAAVDADDTSFDYVASGDIALDAFSGNTYFAFKYVSVGAASGESSVLRIDNVLIATAGSNGGGSGSGGDGTFIVEDFETCENNLPTSWTQFSVENADLNWGCSTFGEEGSLGVVMNGFAGSAQVTDDWLISPVVDLSGSGETFQVSIDRRYAGPDLEILYSTDYSGSGNPSAATWTALPGYSSPAPADANGVWNQIGPLDISTIGGVTTYFAFHYTSNATDGASRYNIDNLLINPDAATGGGSGGGNGGGGTGENILSDDFESCVNDLPAIWSAFSVENPDANWRCSTFGEDGSLAVVMNGFAGGGAQLTDDWLISPALDLSGSGETFQVSLDRRYDGPDLEILYSTNYSGSGDPTSATWTSLPGYSSPAPADANGVWNQIGPLAIGTIGGASTYIAFRYTSSPADGASRYNLDNLIIK